MLNQETNFTHNLYILFLIKMSYQLVVGIHTNVLRTLILIFKKSGTLGNYIVNLVKCKLLK